jgi:Ca-activated chloride channel family protein
VSVSLDAWPWLALLLLLPVGLALASHRRVRLPLPAFGDEIPMRRPGLWARAPGVLRAGVLVLSVLALAGPVRRVERVERRSEGATIMVVFDVSSSMLAEDFRPANRLAVAREALAKFVRGRPDDRIGLVAFAGEAYTAVPATLDHELLLQAVESLDVGQLEDGTAIGTALATAVNRLGDAPPGARVVVLLTDGDNNRGEIAPLAAAEAARTDGVRVHAIGVGRDGVAPVPIGRTRFGYQYADMRVTVNDDLLRALAGATGGVAFRATDPDALSRIWERIDALETQPLSEVRTVERAGVRRGLVALAVGLLLLELAIRASRGRRSLAA